MDNRPKPGDHVTSAEVPNCVGRVLWVIGPTLVCDWKANDYTRNTPVWQRAVALKGVSVCERGHDGGRLAR